MGENGLYLHGMPYFIAPKEQTHVDSILWFGDEFSKDVDTKLLNKKANTKLSHDGMFHTLLGLMNVDTLIYKKSWITFVISNKLMALAIFQSVLVMRLIMLVLEYSLTFKVKSDYNGPNYSA